MSIRVVSSEVEFHGLRSAWQEILDGNPNHTPFQTWEWNFTWWKHFGSVGRLRLLVAEEDGRLIGVAPFQLASRYRGWPTRHLAFIGRKRSDYLDFIVRAGEEPGFFRQLFEYLRDGPTEWGFVELRDLPDGSTNLPHVLREALKCFGVVNVEAGEACVTVPLADSWEKYLAALGKNARRNAGRYRRALEKEHAVSLVIPEAGEPMKKGLRDFADVFRSRWRAEQGATYFEQPRAAAFEQEVCDLAGAAGWYRLYLLYADEVPVAGYLGYVRNNKYYAGLLAHRPDYHKYSVGTVLIGMTIEDCISHGWSDLDMTRGDEPYKYQWNGSVKRNYDLKIFRSRLGMVPTSIVDWTYRRAVAMKPLHRIRAALMRWRFSGERR